MQSFTVCVMIGVSTDISLIFYLFLISVYFVFFLFFSVFRLDALALSVIAIQRRGWVAGCHTPVLYQNR